MIFCVVLALITVFCSAANAVSDAEKQEIVNSHNEWRKNAGSSAMLRLKWNDQLAQYAEGVVAKCAFDHSSNAQRENVAGFEHIGENIYVNSGTTSFKDAIDSWGEEIKDYDLASGSCSAVCGHYTQITWAKTSDVGCAIKQCSNVQGFGTSGGYLVFCNYGTAGNFNNEKPFERGTPGSKCQEVFKTAAGADGLCGEGGSAGSTDNSNNEGSQPVTAAKPDTGITDNSNNGGSQPVTTAKPDNGNGDQGGNDNDNNGNDNGNGNGNSGNDNNGHGNDGNGNDNGNHGNGNNGHGNSGNHGTTAGNGNNGGNGDNSECKDEIWYCHDWLQACNKEQWTHRACRKSCKYC